MKRSTLISRLSNKC